MISSRTQAISFLPLHYPQHFDDISPQVSHFMATRGQHQLFPSHRNTMVPKIRRKGTKRAVFSHVSLLPRKTVFSKTFGRLTLLSHWPELDHMSSD